MSADKSATITGRRCMHCGHGEVTPAAIDAAGDEMCDALVRRGIAIAADDDARDQCPTCASDEVVEYTWTLNSDGQVVPATTTPFKETG